MTIRIGTTKGASISAFEKLIILVVIFNLGD